MSSSELLSAKRDMDLLEQFQQKAMKMMKGLEYPSCEERLRELGLLSWKDEGEIHGGKE